MLTLGWGGGTVTDMKNQGRDKGQVDGIDELDELDELDGARAIVIGVCLGIMLWAVIGLVVVGVWKWTR